MNRWTSQRNFLIHHFDMALLSFYTRFMEWRPFSFRFVFNRFYLILLSEFSSTVVTRLFFFGFSVDLLDPEFFIICVYNRTCPSSFGSIRCYFSESMDICNPLQSCTDFSWFDTLIGCMHYISVSLLKPFSASASHGDSKRLMYSLTHRVFLSLDPVLENLFSPTDSFKVTLCQFP